MILKDKQKKNEIKYFIEEVFPPLKDPDPSLGCGLVNINYFVVRVPSRQINNNKIII